MEKESLPTWPIGTVLLLLLWLLIGFAGGPLTASNSLPAPIPTSLLPHATHSENGSFRWPTSDVEAVRQFGSITAAQSQYMRIASQKLAARWENLSHYQKLTAYLKRAILLVSWTNLCAPAPMNFSIFLMGECFDEQRTALLRLPFQEFMSSYDTTLSRVASFNVLDGITFSRAMPGLSTSDNMLLNIFSILQIPLVALVVAFVPIRLGVKRAFLISVACTLIAGIALQYAIFQEGRATLNGSGGGGLYALQNLRTVFGLGLNILNIGFGCILIGSWIRSHKADWNFGRVQSVLSTQKRKFIKSYDRRKWNALVKYDDDIARAVMQIEPLGDAWIDELAIAYFSLNEDKKYLSSIISKIMRDAEVSGARKVS